MTLTPTVPSKQPGYQAKQVNLQADSKPLDSFTNTSKSTTNWFGSDVVPVELDDDEVGRIRIWLTVATDDIILYTTDGTFFKSVNNGVAITANAEFAFDVRVINTSTFNIKFSTVTANAECFIDQVNRE